MFNENLKAERDNYKGGYEVQTELSRVWAKQCGQWREQAEKLAIYVKMMTLDVDKCCVDDDDMEHIKKALADFSKWKETHG
jgi:hypothetical protein